MDSPSKNRRTLTAYNAAMTGQPTRPEQQHRDAARGVLNKSVVTLAIQPLNQALTLTGRKAYNVMLHIAQNQQRSPDGLFKAPISAILHGYGSTTKLSDRLQTYIEQMVQTTVVWRPLSTGENETLLLEGIEPAAVEPSEEVRTFALLAEARISKEQGMYWVRWSYPPSIQESLLAPQRWARIELASVARLPSYAALALYEICARYKDNPSSLTSRHPPDFWVDVLRDGRGARREYRKFKSEILMRAIREINAETEIMVELIEHRLRGRLETVQFKVKRQRDPNRVPTAADVTLVMRASTHGIREAQVDDLQRRHGRGALEAALDAYERLTAAGQPAPPASEYVGAILAQKKMEPRPSQRSGPARADPADGQLVEEGRWLAERMAQMKAEFDRLPEADKRSWLEAARPQILSAASTTAMTRRRLAEGDWRSPLVYLGVVRAYAEATYGPNWDRPTSTVEG